MFQPVTTLPISKNSIQRLHDNGYQYVEDLTDTSSKIRETVLEAKKSIPTFKMISAFDYFQVEQSVSFIPTMSQSLDDALGNGIKLGVITEICGLPGNGKTQLCMQLCVTVQIPIEYGGLDGEAVYIDTASNFDVSRLEDMAMACSDRFSRDRTEWKNKIFSKIHFLEAFGLEKFCAAIELLENLTEKKPNIKLIIIDSIAFPFKIDCTSIERTGILLRTASKLQRLASEKRIAVVMTNEMSTRIGHGVVAALGGAWAHCVGPRLIISIPHVAVTHSSEKIDTTAKIQITKNGIRDVNPG